MSRVSLSRRSLLAGLLPLAGVLPLGACVETAGDFNPAAPPRARAPSGVPVALVSLDGAPEAVISKLSTAIAGQAARRDITIVGIDGKPRYQLRGYLSAYPSAEGGQRGELSWAFDIFDEQKRRAKRFSGQEPLSAGQDWAAVGEAQLQAVAFKALDEIAEFLAGASEAVAAGARTGGAAKRAAGMLAGG
jgi:hypothetical protein